MTLAASPAIQLSADGITWGAPGAPLQASAGGTFYARLNSTANVDSTTWAVLSTDDVGSAPALTTSGIVSSQVTGTAGAAGTAFILQSTINGLVDKTTGNENPLTTTATAKVWVPAANGLQVVCFDEHAEAGAMWWLPLVNAAIRSAGGSTGAGPVTPTTDGSTTTLASVPIPAGKSVTIRAVVKAKIASAATIVDYFLTVAASFVNVGGVLSTSGAAQGESIIPAAPWSQPYPLQPQTNVTGVANNGSGLCRVAVGSTSGLTSGDIIAIAGAATSGGLVINGTWAIDVFDGTHIDLRESTFTGSWSSGGTVTPLGCVSFSASGANALLQITGITAPAWKQSEGVRGGDVRSNASGVWLCSQAGTTSNSGSGPSGSGTVAGVSDGSAKWDRLDSGTGVPISWQLMDLRPYTI